MSPEELEQCEDSELVARLTAIVREADQTFERVGGSSRHWVRDCFLPLLNRAGWYVAACPAGIPDTLTFEVVVNGQPIHVTVKGSATVRDIIEPALTATGTVSRPDSEWEVRLTEGQPILLDQPLAPHAGERLWINLRAGYAAAVRVLDVPEEPT